jgi:hypothetical protein
MAFQRIGFTRSEIKIGFLQPEWRADAMEFLAMTAIPARDKKTKPI